MSVFQYAPRNTGSPERQLTPLGCATVPRRPHTTALGVACERTSADVQLGERGA